MIRTRRLLVVSIMLCIMLMTCVHIPAFAASISAHGNASHSHSDISCVAVLGGMLYTLEGGYLNAVQQPGQASETILFIGDYVTIDQSFWDWLMLVSDGEHLYLLSPFDGNLYVLEGNSLQKMIQLDVSKIGRAAIDGLRYVLFSSPVIVDDYLYLLSLSPDNMLGTEEIYRFSLADGRSERMQVDTNGFTPYNALEPCELLSSGSHELLVHDLNSNALLQVDTERMRVISSKLALPDNENGMFVSDDHGDLYFLSGMRVMRWDGQSLTDIDRVPFSGPLEAKAAVLWNGQYTVLASSAGLYACGEKSNNVTAAVLTIWDGSGSFFHGDIVTKFMIEHPNIAVELVGNKEDDPLEKLTTVNMTKDTSIDLFLLPSYLIDSGEIYSRGFAAPIHSTFLADDVKNMYPQLRDFLMDGSVLYGYPAELWPNYWTVRQDLLEEASNDSLPFTYDEYLDLMIRWYEKNHNVKQGITFDGSRSIEEQQSSALDTLLVQYIRANTSTGHPISFNTPEFRSFLEKLNSLSRWKDEFLVTAGETEHIFCPKATSPFNRSLNPKDAGERCIIPPAFPGKTAYISASLDYFIICPASEHRSEAIQFLEFYRQNMEQDVRYALYEHEMEPVEREDYQTEASERRASIETYRNAIANEEQAIKKMIDDDMIASSRELIHDWEVALAAEEAALAQETDRWVYSPDVISEYKAIAPYISIKDGDLVWAITETIDAKSILMRYFMGTATLDQVLNELDSRVSMMFYEGQF